MMNKRGKVQRVDMEGMVMGRGGALYNWEERRMENKAVLCSTFLG